MTINVEKRMKPKIKAMAVFLTCITSIAFALVTIGLLHNTYICGQHAYDVDFNEIDRRSHLMGSSDFVDVDPTIMQAIRYSFSTMCLTYSFAFGVMNHALIIEAREYDSGIIVFQLIVQDMIIIFNQRIMRDQIIYEWKQTERNYTKEIMYNKSYKFIGDDITFFLSNLPQ